MNSQRESNICKRLYTKTINLLICLFTGHDIVHTHENRDNHVRHLVLATDRCTRCHYRKVYKHE